MVDLERPGVAEPIEARIARFDCQTFCRIATQVAAAASRTTRVHFLNPGAAGTSFKNAAAVTAHAPDDRFRSLPRKENFRLRKPEAWGNSIASTQGIDEPAPWKIDRIARPLFARHADTNAINEGLHLGNGILFEKTGDHRL